ncbi:hypothetical protein vseg_006538 [Gypsophila vaccaria]
MADIITSTVMLRWFNRLDPDAEPIISSGFVWRLESNALHILSSAEQVKTLFMSSGRPEYIGITVTFYDNCMDLEGHVTRLEFDQNISSIRVNIAPQLLSSPPLCLVKAAPVTREPLYCRQAIFSIHHPMMKKLGEEKWTLVTFQHTEGFIVDANLQASGKVHFHMPQIMEGSFGAPVFDAKSRRVLCMVQSSSHGTSVYGRQEQRLEGYPASKIIEFIRHMGAEPEI